MNKEKKSLIIHYIEEFVIISLGLLILLGLLSFTNFTFTLTLLSIWVFLFNAIIFTYWFWKSESKKWEKIIALLYFFLVEFVIILADK